MYLLHSLLFLTVRGQCPPAALLNVSAHRVCGRPVLLLPSPTSHTDFACAYLRRSIFSTWPPHFHFRLCATATISCLFQHPSPCRCTQHAVFSVPSSANNCGTTSFPFPPVTMFRYRTIGPGIHRIPGRLPLSPVFGICRPVQSRKLLTRETCLPTRKENRLTETND